MRVGERYTGVTSVLSKVRKGGRATYVATVLNSHWECVARVGRDAGTTILSISHATSHMLAPNLAWQGPCLLEPQLLQQRLLDYDPSIYNFVGIAEQIFSTNDLVILHDCEIQPWDKTPPALRRAQVQARIGARVGKQERKGARRNAWDFDRSEGWREFMEVYQKFITDWVMPQFGDEAILYQRKPILRVVLPGSVAPTQLHCDADYYHDANELNYW